MRASVFVMSAVALAIGMGGCASGGAAAAKKTTVTVSVSPTPPQATVKQYAGLVNSTMKDMRTTWQDYQNDGCDFQSATACDLNLMAFQTDAEMLVSDLTAAQSPGSSGYLGPPPAEIAQLVTETLADAQSVENDITLGGKQEAGAGFAIQGLLTDFDKWDPYI